MKHLLILITIQFFTAPAFCQQTVPGTHAVSKDFLAKSKKQKTAGWILTGTGTATLLFVAFTDASQEIGGVLVHTFSLGFIPQPENKSYAAGYALSTALLAGGISLFVISSKNKKKATNFSLQNQASTSAFKGTLTTTDIPSLTVKISL